MIETDSFDSSFDADAGRLIGAESKSAQEEAIERALSAEVPCGEVLNLVASVRGAVTGLTAELIEDHVREHISNPDKDDDPARAQGAAEL